MDSGRDTLAGGFPHSEISGSTLDCQLPGAFRRLSRLSSPVVAKASTVCACSLDPITRNPVDAPHGRGSGFALYVTFAARDRSRALLRTFHIVKEQSRLEPRSRRRRPEPISNAIALHGTCKINQSTTTGSAPIGDGLGYPFGAGRGGGARRVRTADPRLAKPALSRLSYGPTAWWVWVDSNHRPHPYQGCALTA